MREELISTVAKLKTACIRGRWLAAEKFHLTLQFLGDFVGADEIVRRAIGAAECLRFAPFDFVLDRAESFPRRFNPPCVLRCAEASVAPLCALSQQLADALGAAGLAEHLETRPYMPHVTVAYLERDLREPIVIEPIGWHAHEFALIDSSGGAHRELGRWPLRA